MIVKFFNRGTGGGSGPVDYLLGKDRKREDATLNQGDCDSVINLINSCEFTQKYKSGCLSFEEQDLPQAEKDKLMAEFEKVLLPGLDKNQYSILWVEHKDKGRLELNFVVPCVELTTAKRLQPYYHKIDEKRVDTWKRIVNTSLNLHDPDAPENKRAVKPLNVTNLPQSVRDKRDHINNALLNQIEIGLVKNRSDIVISLKAAGFTVTRTDDKNKKTISIKNPDGGKNIKLEGEIYESTFQFSREYASRVRADEAAFRATRPADLERNKETLRGLIEKKSECNRKLYQAGRGRNRLDARKCEERNQLIDPLSHIQDVEIQRGHSLNNGGIHRRVGGGSLLDREHGERQHPKDNSAKRSVEIRGDGSTSRQWEKLSNSPIEHRGKSIQQRHLSSMGAEINDRTRKNTLERIGEIIGRSGNNVSRDQKFFREVGRKTASATKVLRDFTGRKPKSDSVSRGLEESFGNFDRALDRVVRAVENKLEQEKKPSISTFSPKF